MRTSRRISYPALAFLSPPPNCPHKLTKTAGPLARRRSRLGRLRTARRHGGRTPLPPRLVPSRRPPARVARNHEAIAAVVTSGTNAICASIASVTCLAQRRKGRPKRRECPRVSLHRTPGRKLVLAHSVIHLQCGGAARQPTASLLAYFTSAVAVLSSHLSDPRLRPSGRRITIFRGRMKLKYRIKFKGSHVNLIRYLSFIRPRKMVI